MDISTNYMGLSLRSPIIAGSCGLTNSLENLKALENAGVGAIVIKSIFEEEISYEVSKMSKTVSESSQYYQDAYDYIKNYTTENRLEKYLNFIKKAKNELKTPIIASINCVSFSDWISFIKKIQDAGADAIELNIFELPANVNLSYEDVERLFFDTVAAIRKTMDIPVAIKTGCYFTDMAKFMQRLSWTGIKSLVLFNRFFNPDIDIENLTYKPAKIYSDPSELSQTLRWTAILSKLIKCDLSASTGVKNGEDVVKLLLAGAQTVQVASCLYEKGLDYVKTMNSELIDWMESKNLQNINSFRGKMALIGSENPSAILRTQFMKHFSGIE